MLNIALPKGRMGDKVLKLFSQIGFGELALGEDSRKLVVESPDGRVRYLLVKPSDVAIYVERGAADHRAVAGKDTLMETEPDVYELLDLKFGKCVVAVAAKNGWVEDVSLPLRVATKYVNIAQNYYLSLNRRSTSSSSTGQHRAGADPGPVGRDCGHCGNRYHAQGKRFERVQRDRAFERAPDRKPARATSSTRPSSTKSRRNWRQSYDSHFAQP